eukprot:1189061-Prymnesium_polylepis.1
MCAWGKGARHGTALRKIPKESASATEPALRISPCHQQLTQYCSRVPENAFKQLALTRARCRHGVLAQIRDTHDIRPAINTATTQSSRAPALRTLECCTDRYQWCWSGASRARSRIRWQGTWLGYPWPAV